MTKMEFLNKLKLLPLAALLVATGCARKTIYEPIPDPDQTQVDRYEVNFRAAGLELTAGEAAQTQRQRTKAAIDLPDGQTIKVAVYRSSGEFELQKDYTVNEYGTIVPDDGEEMTLGKGTFDFYAYGPTTLSLNTATKVVGGVPAAGIDLIAASATGQTVGSSDREIALTFTHLCSKVEFSVGPEAGYAITSLSVTDATLTGMAAGPVDYTLGQALTAGYSAGQTVTLSGFTADATTKVNTASQVVLPKTNNGLTVSFTLSLNGGPAQTLTGTVGSLAFVAGKYYRFNALLRTDELTLTLDVADWDEVSFPNGGFQSVTLGTWTGVDWTTEFDGNASGNTNQGVSGWEQGDLGDLDGLGF